MFDSKNNGVTIGTEASDNLLGGTNTMNIFYIILPPPPINSIY